MAQRRLTVREIKETLRLKWNSPRTYVVARVLGHRSFSFLMSIF